jgi:hypothetical protein
LTITQKVKQLKDKIDEISKDIDRVVIDISSTSETSSGYWHSINSRLRSDYESLRILTREWVTSNLPAEYYESIKDEIVRLKSKAVFPDNYKDIDSSEFVNSHFAKQSLAALLNDTLSAYSTGYLSGERELVKLARLTQQINVTEKNMNKLMEEGYNSETEGGYQRGVRGSKMKIRDELLKKAIDGKYIRVVDKNGDVEMWDASKYAELVARTKIMEAETQGVLNTTIAVGGDLVQIDAHNADCAICAPYEGKIYSISGNDPDFPPVEDLPPFHPHCAHSITTVFREGLIADGTLDKYIAFSNGDSEEHPTRSSFIPVSERELV